MSDSESDFNLSSEGEEEDEIMEEEEEEEEEYYSEELREKLFSCSAELNDLPSENSQIKKSVLGKKTLKIDQKVYNNIIKNKKK